MRYEEVRRGRKPRPVMERLMAKVVADENGCWIWQGALGNGGYGKIHVRGADGRDRIVSTHRVAYEVTVGAVPDGLELDHLCRVRRCCNPEHLEAVPPAVNRERGEGMTVKHARWQYCGGERCTTCASRARRVRLLCGFFIPQQIGVAA